MIKAHQDLGELRLPRIGTIRKGAPKPERGPGKDLDYFRLDRTDPAVAAAWVDVMGKEPKSISGILPYSDPADNLSIWDELWQGKRLLWRGDGERLHVQLQGNAYVRYAAGQGPAQPAAAGEMVNKLKVARVSRLRLLLPQLGVAGIFEVMSSSAIDADELWANLMWIRSIVATLQGAPVTVFRAERQFNVAQDDGKTMIVKKHMLHLMLDGRSLSKLLPSPDGPLLAPPAASPALALSAGHDDDDDAPEDGEYEDAPAAVDPVAAFVTQAEQRPGVQAVSFANGRLTDWVKYVTNDKFDPTQAEFLNQVLDRYCSAVADNGNKHTRAVAEKARADYEAGIFVLSGQREGLIDADSPEMREAQAAKHAEQDDLFGAEYDARQEELKAAALATARNG